MGIGALPGLHLSRKPGCALTSTNSILALIDSIRRAWLRQSSNATESRQASKLFIRRGSIESAAIARSMQPSKARARLTRSAVSLDVPVASGLVDQEMSCDDDHSAIPEADS